MIILGGIKNFLVFVNEHWTEILVVAGLALVTWKRVKEYLQKTDEEKIQIAKTQIKETILRLVTQAEEDYADWVKAGAVKRAQVIEEIFRDYPILSRVTDQDSLIKEIDKMIDEALVELRDILSKN